MWEKMWANTVWGLFGFAFACLLAVPGVEATRFVGLQPWFIWGAVIFFAAGVACLVEPIFRQIAAQRQISYEKREGEGYLREIIWWIAEHSLQGRYLSGLPGMEDQWALYNMIASEISRQAGQDELTIRARRENNIDR